MIQKQNSEKSPAVIDGKMSIYRDGEIGPKEWAEGMVRIINAFHAMKEQTGWFEELKRMIKLKGFTAQRFNDAIDNLICGCRFKEPAIADIIQFDQLIETFTRDEIMLKLKDNKNIFMQYETVNIDGKIYYVKNGIAEKYGLTKHVPQKLVPLIKKEETNENDNDKSETITEAAMRVVESKKQFHFKSTVEIKTKSIEEVKKTEKYLTAKTEFEKELKQAQTTTANSTDTK